MSQEKLSTKKLRAGKKRLKDYGKVLLAKQLLRALYNNPRERTFKKYFLSLGNANRASIKKRSSLATSSVNYKSNSASTVFENLNSRLDIVLTAMGGALSSKHAQQLINHGKITVNGHIIKERGYLLQNGDIIASTENFKLKRSQDAIASAFETVKSELGTSRVKDLNAVMASGKHTLRNQIACLKPKKIPSRLHLKTPVFAHLLINTELNYGIYYSKPNLFFLEAESNSYDSDARQTLNKDTPVMLDTIPGEGWKNTNVKVVKSLLFDLNLALQELNALNVCDKPVEDNLKKKTLGDISATAPELRIKYIKRIKSIYSILYSLVQAYYSRQH